MIRKKDYGKIVLGLLIFFYLSIPVVLIMRFGFGMQLSNEDGLSLVLVDFAASGIMASLLVALYGSLLKNDAKKLKRKYLGKGILGYLETVIIAFLIMNVFKYAGSILTTIIETLFHIETEIAENQSLIETLLGSAPVLMIISACLFAPITEEVLFRGGIGKVIKNKKVFIAVSGVIFGLMHVTSSVVFILELLLLGVILDFLIQNKNDTKKLELSITCIVILLVLCGGIYYLQYGNLLMKIASLNVSEIVNSILYITMGVYLALIYVKTENIYISIGVHAMNNIVSMIMLLFLV